jgi:hypothetical protein
MNKAKYFRVKKKTSINEDTIYQVESADTFIEVIFGYWCVYTKENKTLEEAVLQIETLNKYKIKTEKTVFKKTIL